MISKIVFLGNVMKKKWYFILFLFIVMSSVDAQSSGGYGFCPRERYITLATGPTLEYVEQGLPMGECVIFVHGYTDSWFSYSRVLSLLSPWYHSFALTMRGHGDSSKNSELEYDIADFSADLIAFMDAKNIDQAVIVGHSMGSFIAQYTGVYYPERVKGLVLIGTGEEAVNNPVLDGLKSYVDTLEDPIDRAFVSEFQSSTVFDPVPDEFLENVMDESMKVPAFIWKEALEGLNNTDLSAYHSALDMPVLIFWGDNDGIFTLDEQNSLALNIPDTTLKLYKNTGHGLHWEKPVKFTKDLIRFLIQF